MWFLPEWLDQYEAAVRQSEMYFRILLSALVGFVIGWNREAKNKPGGIKTYMFVCVACALMTLISIYSVERYGNFNPNTSMDPMRVAAQIVSGLGFLGAGMILKSGLRVIGLTSAAMVLFVGGAGIGIGAGFYGVVLFAVAVTMTMAAIGNAVERGRWKKRQTVEGVDSASPADAVEPR
jgi:putative Mg2+ transporter-C (MgtC) family protein